MAWFDKLKDVFKTKKVKLDDNLETIEQYKERWRSVYVVYFTMFLMSLGFSIIVTGVWPYLDKLDPTAGKEFMGLIVAANPFAQMLFSPLVGWWSNKLGSIRFPLIFSLLVFAAASSIYSSLELFDSYRKHWMLWTRFLVGVSSASVAACRSYLSAATRLNERTKAVSMISLAQVLGFIVGPAIQACVVPLGDVGVWLIPKRLRLNMYTASGWINVVLTLINIYLFFPSVFKEHKIAVKEALLKQGKDSEKDTCKLPKPDLFPTWTLIVAFFIIVFNFMLLETLGTPITMDQFAWSKEDSLWYMGVLMSVGALTSIITFASIAPLVKRFSEVKVMIWGGFLFMVLGQVFYIPFDNAPAVIYDENLKLNLSRACKIMMNNATSDTIDENMLSDINKGLSKYNKSLSLNASNEENIIEMTLNCGEHLLGCPSSQKWCLYTPAITVTQFVAGYVLTVFGYPLGVTLIQTIFSKVLGPRPQGVWMGLMTGSGCLSRVLGPVFITYIYQQYGTIWTFGMTATMMTLMLCWLFCFQRRLVPEELNTETSLELKEDSNFISGDCQDEIS